MSGPVVHLRRRSTCRAGGLALAILAGLAGVARAAPETFNTALPVPKGEFIFREQFLYKKASDDPSPADREVTVGGGISVLGYGVTGDFAVFGVLPYLHKSLDVTTAGGQRVTRDTDGIGDARLFARYTVFHDDAPGRTFRVSPFAGVELPTGDDDDSDALGTLPATLQLGSGSWDPFVGIVATYQTLAYEVDVATSYKANTEANGFAFGDEARFDASLQYRLWPRVLKGGLPGFLYGVLETNLIHQDKDEIGGADDPNSGGVTLFVSPGVQYVTRRWVLEAIVQLPAFQDLNGSALEDDFTVRAGFRFNF
ncbi:MAG: transporter [Alphaproteobacteria bacterium]